MAVAFQIDDFTALRRLGQAWSSLSKACRGPYIPSPNHFFLGLKDFAPQEAPRSISLQAVAPLLELWSRAEDKKANVVLAYVFVIIRTARMDIFGEATSIQTKIIAALALLFLFFVFLIMITWDRYGREVSALYEARLENTSRMADADDDEFKAYKSLPTFFYEYAKKKKQS